MGEYLTKEEKQITNEIQKIWVLWVTCRGWANTVKYCKEPWSITIPTVLKNKKYLKQKIITNVSPTIMRIF